MASSGVGYTDALFAYPPSMYLDANDQGFQRSLVHCDIAIVGAGPAGITLASAFKNTKMQVCILESGGFDAASFPQELSTGKVHSPSPALDKDYISQHSQRLFGGTGSVWGGYCRPLDAIDFEQRDLPCTHRWPFPLAELDPYYPWGALENKQDQQQVPASRLLIKHYERVIYPFNSVHRNEFLSDQNISVILHATVRDIILHDPQSVAHLNVVNTGSATETSHKSFQVKAKVYILACGGIGNVKLLLNSDGVAKKGIGNQRDQVGRHFMEHPHFQFFTPPALLWLGDKKAGWLYRSERYKPAFYLQQDLVRDEKLLNFCAMVSAPFEPQSQLAGSKLYRPRFASLSDREGAYYSLAFRCEQSPHADSRVILSPEKDALGMRRVQLDWKLQEIDRWSLFRSIDLLIEELGRASLGRVKLILDRQQPWTTMVGGGHLMGTTAMGHASEDSVTDPHGRIHSMDNLYVAGSSLFPTSGVSNPTLTLMALARRLAAHLQDKLRGG